MNGWRRQSDYYIRGRLPGDPKEVPGVPYECVHVDNWGTSNANAERYWEVFGLTRDMTDVPDS